jgi:hypothetical protein
MPEFIEVTAEVLAERQAADRQRQYEQRQQARMGNLFDANGNPISFEALRAEMAKADDMKRQADLDFRENQRIRAEEARAAALEAKQREDAEAEAFAAQVKAQKFDLWLAQGRGSRSEFEDLWRRDRNSFFRDAAAGEESLDAKIRRQKLASGHYT